MLSSFISSHPSLPAQSEVSLPGAFAAAAVASSVAGATLVLAAGQRMCSGSGHIVMRKINPGAWERKLLLQMVTKCQQLLCGTGDLKSDSIIANKP